MARLSQLGNMAPTGYNLEALDELLAASLAAEENRSFIGNASTFAMEVPSEEDDADEDEEMILRLRWINVVVKLLSWHF